MNVVILSPLQLELDACLEQFSDVSTTSKGALSYAAVHHETKFAALNLLFRKTGSGLYAVAQATEQAIKDWKPALILLVGVAGSIKDAVIGDLVIATKAYGYDAGKETPTGFAARPDVVPTTPLMLTVAEQTGRHDHWRSFLDPIGYSPVIHFGPIASGDKVVASTDSRTFGIIKAHYNDTLAVEMESVGFAKACLHHPLVQCLNIRGISDRVDGKSRADAEGHQAGAARVAAAFMRGLLEELNPSQFNFSAMELKPLVKQIMEFIMPILKMEAGQEIGRDFREATNTTIREIWDRVRPLFIEEFEDFREEQKEEILDEIPPKIQRKLRKDELFRKELTQLVERAKETPAGQNIIQNSKNVIQGSNITVGGDFRLGDDINPGPKS